jgi:putative membrane protein
MAEPSPPVPVDVADMAVKQAVMAAERTWLAWWRSALVALAGALAVGRVTPQVLHVASWPYVLLGVGYGLIAIGMVIVGALRHERLARVTLTSADSTVDSRLIAAFSAAGVAIAACTLALILAQS